MKQFIFSFLSFCLLAQSAHAAESVEIKETGVVPKRVFRIPAPRPPFKTLVYETKAGEKRMARHFSEKIATYLNIGDVQQQIYLDGQMLYDSPLRNILHDYMLLIWEGKSCPQFELNDKKEIMLREHLVRFEFLLEPGKRFPEKTLESINSLWQMQVESVLEPAGLSEEVMTYNGQPVWFGVLWAGQRIEHDGFYNRLGDKISRLYAGDDTGNDLNEIAAEKNGDLYYQENPKAGIAPLQMLFYIVKDGVPVRITEAHYLYVLTRGVMKEMLIARRTIREIERWKNDRVADVNRWQAAQFPGGLKAYEENLVAWQKEEVESLKLTKSLAIRGDALRHFESNLQERKNGIAEARASLNDEAIRRIQFFNQEAARQVKEFKFYGYLDLPMRDQLARSQIKTWEEFDKGFARVRTQVEQLAGRYGKPAPVPAPGTPGSPGPTVPPALSAQPPAPGAVVTNPPTPKPDAVLPGPVGKRYETVAEFIKRRENDGPIPYTLPKACKSYLVTLDTNNSLDLFFVDKGQRFLLVKGLQNILDLVCVEDALLLLLQKVKHIPEEVKKLSLEPNVTMEQIQAGIPEGLAIGVLRDKVVVLHKALKKRPFFRANISSIAGFFNIFYSKDEEEEGVVEGDVSRRFALRVRIDGSKIERFFPKNENPEKEPLELSELLDASRRYVDLSGGAAK